MIQGIPNWGPEWNIKVNTPEYRWKLRHSHYRITEQPTRSNPRPYLLVFGREMIIQRCKPRRPYSNRGTSVKVFKSSSVACHLTICGEKRMYLSMGLVTKALSTRTPVYRWLRSPCSQEIRPSCCLWIGTIVRWLPTPPAVRSLLRTNILFARFLL